MKVLLVDVSLLRQHCPSLNYSGRQHVQIRHLNDNLETLVCRAFEWTLSFPSDGWITNEPAGQMSEAFETWPEWHHGQHNMLQNFVSWCWQQIEDRADSMSVSVYATQSSRLIGHHVTTAEMQSLSVWVSCWVFECLVAWIQIFLNNVFFSSRYTAPRRSAEVFVLSPTVACIGKGSIRTARADSTSVSVSAPQKSNKQERLVLGSVTTGSLNTRKNIKATLKCYHWLCGDYPTPC